MPSLPARRLAAAAGFTLVEMLIAMAITLVMIGAVVTLFANMSNSVRNRRAVIEMSGQLRHARNMLQQDLQGATCNGLVWQRPDENQGYIEIIEGPRREGQASVLGRRRSTMPAAPEFQSRDRPRDVDPAVEQRAVRPDPTWATDGGSLGDYDDILMLTVRNEHEPFVGRVPLSDGVGSGDPPAHESDSGEDDSIDWKSTTIESPLAEVVWYAVENPEEDSNADGFFGEPGMRTIYRAHALDRAVDQSVSRAPTINGVVNDTFQLEAATTFTAKPGLVRILAHNNVDADDVPQAIAALDCVSRAIRSLGAA